MKSANKVTSFYDNFVLDQIKKAFNERHLALIQKIRQQGLGNDSSVLEIGCGIGAMTYLICEVDRKGKIESCDISAKSIECAKQLNRRNKNVTFYTGDILSLKTNQRSFDYILLLDVLEHIPIKDHGKLFHILRSKMHFGSKLIINIPNPKHTEYLEKHDRSALQVIDQPLASDTLVKTAYDNDLLLYCFETYSTWLKDEYQFIVFHANKGFELQKVNTKKNTRNLIRMFRRRVELRKLFRSFTPTGS